MTTLLLTLLFLFVIVAAMAIGVMFGRPPIKGSCGGMSALAGQGECLICGGDPVKCETASRQPDVAARGEDNASGSPAPGTVRRFDPRDPR